MMFANTKSALWIAAIVGTVITMPAVATAAGMAVKAAPTAGYSWTGLYLSVFASYVDGRVVGDPIHLSATGITDDDGFVVGVLGGYRYHLPSNVVLGAQVAAPIWADRGAAIGTSAFLAGTTMSVKNNFAVLFTGQLGYAYGRFLPFIALGFGFANVTSTTLGAPVGPPVQEATGNHLLFTAGLGVDYAVTNNVVVGLRYSYLQVGRDAHVTPLNAGVTDNTFGLDSHAITLAIAFRLCHMAGATC